MVFDEDDRTVETTWVGRCWRRLMSIFRSNKRRMTEAENDLMDQIVVLRRELEEEKLVSKDLTRQLDECEAKVRVQDVEIAGMAGIIAMHEKHWEKEQAILSAKIAGAGRIAASELAGEL